MKKIIIILGPTATHKTQLSLCIAEKFPVEIISADSMQFYIGMEIGTDKVEKDIRNKVPHHLIDVVTVQEEFNVSEFKKQVEKVIRDIFKRKKVPLIVGGSGLYIKSITEGFPVEFSAPPDAVLREELNMLPFAALRKTAESIDKNASDKVGDRKRLIRIVEFFRQTGYKISSVENQEVRYEFLKIGLTKERELLYRDIEKRVDEMFDRGFVEEVKRLRDIYSNWSKTALQAIGYGEVLQYLNGIISLKEAKEEIKKRTRHLAKKQITWFKKENNVYWIDTADFNDAKEQAEKLVKEFLYEHSN
ncbi:MAG: tRNA (adenosine(37)-N6)-dimethylallyltransferase MiaA [Caldisericaceae bacterium]|nr:tRNA (adenosine(37)-N6)-dimethylallyltransferase MiaA [Caldisericaceae bacterium]